MKKHYISKFVQIKDEYFSIFLQKFSGDSTILATEMNGNFIEPEKATVEFEKRTSPENEKKTDGKENANHNGNNSSDSGSGNGTTEIGRKSPQRCPSRTRPDLRVLIPPRSHHQQMVSQNN